MSFTYYLDLGPGAPPPVLQALVADMNGQPPSGRSLAVTLASIAADDAGLAHEHHGFRPEWRLAFRQHQIAGAEDLDHQVFKRVHQCLSRLAVDAVVETQDPVTVLVRRGGSVVLNRLCDAARWAAPFYPQAQWAELPPL